MMFDMTGLQRIDSMYAVLKTSVSLSLLGISHYNLSRPQMKGLRILMFYHYIIRFSRD